MGLHWSKISTAGAAPTFLIVRTLRIMLSQYPVFIKKVIMRSPARRREERLEVRLTPTMLKRAASVERKTFARLFSTKALRRRP